MSYPHSEEMVERIRLLWFDPKNNANTVAAAVGLTKNQVIGIVYRNRYLGGEGMWPIKGSGWQNANAGWWATKARKARKAVAAPVHHPKPQPAQKPTVSHSLPTEGLVRFLDSRRGQCKFPFWDDTRNWKPDRVETVMVCGRPVEGEGSWCSAHKRLCFDARRTAASSRPFRHKALELA